MTGSEERAVVGEQMGRSEARARADEYAEQLERLELELEGLELAKEATSQFDDFVAEFKAYAEAAKRTKEGIDGAAADVGHLRDLLEASIQRFISAHAKLNGALTSVAEGLEKSGKQLGRLTDKLTKLTSLFDRITNVPKMTGELTDDELIEAFTGYFKLLTEVLSKLTTLFPPLAAMLSWYGEVVASLEQPLKAIAAGKARTNEHIASWDELLDDPYGDHDAPPPRSALEEEIAAKERQVETLREAVAHWNIEADYLDRQYRDEQADAVEDTVRRQGGSEAGYLDRLAGHLRSSPWIDDEIVQTLFGRYPDLEQKVRAEPPSSGDADAATPVSMGVGGAGAAAAVVNRSGGRRIIWAAAGVLAVAAVGVPVLLLGDGGAPASSPASSAASAASSPSGGSTGGVPAAASEPDACEAARERDHQLTFTSPAIPAGGVIPPPYDSLYSDGVLPSPPFEWSGVPAETTELAIYVVGRNGETGQLLLTDDDPWRSSLATDPDRGVGWLGDAKWKVTGIDPATTSLPAMSFEEARQSDLTLHPLSISTTIDGENVSGFFYAPGGATDVFLFTLFALCRTTNDVPDSNLVGPGWLINNSIAEAHFVATAS